MQSDKGAGKRKRGREKMKTNDEQDGPTVKLKVQDEHNKLNNNTTKYQTILLKKK